jgi:hypothetical protein
MQRREFLSLVGGAAMAWPVVARAQQSPKVLRIGITTVQPRNSPPYAALDQRLRELGYVDGQNLAVDFLNPDTLNRSRRGLLLAPTPPGKVAVTWSGSMENAVKERNSK